MWRIWREVQNPAYFMTGFDGRSRHWKSCQRFWNLALFLRPWPPDCWQHSEQILLQFNGHGFCRDVPSLCHLQASCVIFCSILNSSATLNNGEIFSQSAICCCSGEQWKPISQSLGEQQLTEPSHLCLFGEQWPMKTLADTTLINADVASYYADFLLTYFICWCLRVEPSNLFHHIP
jgi:hypothetical protein